MCLPSVRVIEFNNNFQPVSSRLYSADDNPEVVSFESISNETLETYQPLLPETPVGVSVICGGA